MDWVGVEPTTSADQQFSLGSYSFKSSISHYQEHGRESRRIVRYQPDASWIQYVKIRLSKYQPGVWKSLSMETSGSQYD
jgi:hypothetical protein